MCKTVPGKHGDRWTPAEVTYHQCRLCGTHMPWQRRYQSDTLVASCCGFIWQADSLFDRTKFHVTVQKADLSNVRVLSVVDRTGRP